MMKASFERQKQKRNPSKPRHIARSIVGSFLPLSEAPLKRIGLVGIGVLTGVGVPALVYASQQQVAPKKQPHSSSTVTVQSSTASSPSEEAASLSNESSSESHSQTDPSDNNMVVINGEKMTTDNGTVSKQIINDDGSQLDVNVTIDNGSSGSSSSNNSTSVYIDSNSSTSTTQDPVRGSPRR